MGANGFGDAVELFDGESAGGQEFAGACDGVGDVVPAFQLRLVAGAMADIDAQIVHPGRGKKDVVVVVHTLADGSCKSV